MKSKSSKAFIEKIKTIGIITSKAKPDGETTCPNSGKKAHLVACVPVVRIQRIKPKPSNDEESFAA